MSTRKPTGKRFLKTGFARMMGVLKKSLKRPSPLSAEAVVASHYLVWPERARPAKSGIGGVKGHDQNKIFFPGSPALWAESFTSETSEVISYILFLT